MAEDLDLLDVGLLLELKHELLRVVAVPDNEHPLGPSRARDAIGGADFVDIQSRPLRSSSSSSGTAPAARSSSLEQYATSTRGAQMRTNGIIRAHSPHVLHLSTGGWAHTRCASSTTHCHRTQLLTVYCSSTGGDPLMVPLRKANFGRRRAERSRSGGNRWENGRVLCNKAPSNCPSPEPPQQTGPPLRPLCFCKRSGSSKFGRDYRLKRKHICTK